MLNNAKLVGLEWVWDLLQPGFVGWAPCPPASQNHFNQLRYWYTLSDIRWAGSVKLPRRRTPWWLTVAGADTDLKLGAQISSTVPPIWCCVPQLQGHRWGH